MAKTALVSIDDQVEFNDRKKGRLFIDGAEGVSDTKVAAMEFARNRPDILTIVVQRRNPGTDSGCQLVEPDRREATVEHEAFGEKGYCVGEHAAAFPAELGPREGDFFVHKTGNSACECDEDLPKAMAMLAKKGIEEPHGMETHAFEPLLEEKGITDTVLIGTQFKRCLLGMAIDLRAKGYEVTVLMDAAAKQDMDETKKVKDDPVLLATLKELEQKHGIPVNGSEPINTAVARTLQELGVKLATFSVWQERMEQGQGRSAAY